MRHRLATPDDSPVLAELSALRALSYSGARLAFGCTSHGNQLIRDEGHRNAMTVPQLEDRMRGWLTSGEYRGVLFEDDGGVIAYALFRETEAEVSLRQFFVARHRRRHGVGRGAMHVLRPEVWPRHTRLTVSVLVTNQRGVAFWRAMGYRDYDLTLEIMPS